MVVAITLISLLFIVFLLVLIADTEIAAEANNSVVHALFGVFTALFVLLSGLHIWECFSENDKVNQVLLYKTQDSVKKASVGVIRKLAKKAVGSVEHAKVCHIHLFVDVNGEVTMKAAVKIIDKQHVDIDVSSILDNVNNALVEEFQSTLGFKFKEIILKLVAVKTAKASKEQSDGVEIVSLPETIDEGVKKGKKNKGSSEEKVETVDSGFAEPVVDELKKLDEELEALVIADEVEDAEDILVDEDEVLK